jgi:hypothetical protein
MLTDDALEAITTCYLAEQIGKVFSPAPEWLGACEDAREKGWLARSWQDDHVVYITTPAAHQALDYAERRN